ncbi:hypothetical protein MRX96_043240 [Rhipicephalus microplus]
MPISRLGFYVRKVVGLRQRPVIFRRPPPRTAFPFENMIGDEKKTSLGKEEGWEEEERLLRKEALSKAQQAVAAKGSLAWVVGVAVCGPASGSSRARRGDSLKGFPEGCAPFLETRFLGVAPSAVLAGLPFLPERLSPLLPLFFFASDLLYSRPPRSIYILPGLFFASFPLSLSGPARRMGPAVLLSCPRMHRWVPHTACRTLASLLPRLSSDAPSLWDLLPASLYSLRSRKE